MCLSQLFIRQLVLAAVCPGGGICRSLSFPHR